jgi:hypothetical protein
MGNPPACFGPEQRGMVSLYQTQVETKTPDDRSGSCRLPSNGKAILGRGMSRL